MGVTNIRAYNNNKKLKKTRAFSLWKCGSIRDCRIYKNEKEGEISKKFFSGKNKQKINKNKIRNKCGKYF